MTIGSACSYLGPDYAGWRSLTRDERVELFKDSHVELAEIFSTNQGMLIVKLNIFENKHPQSLRQ